MTAYEIILGIEDCRKQKEITASFKREVKANPSKLKELSGLYYDKLWKVIGCQHHKIAEPCGNKKERGVPHGANCNDCPFD